MRTRFMLYVACGLFCGLMFLVVKPLLAANAPAPAAEKHLEFEITFQDKTRPKLVAKLITPEVTIKTSVGSTTILREHLEIITVAKDNPEFSAIELHEHDRIRGTLLTNSLTVEDAQGIKTIPMAEIREVKAVHEKTSGFTALAIGLITLAAMEIVLGIDNIIFLAILVGKLPEEQQKKGRQYGLGLALGTRILLLLSLSFIMGLTTPIITLPDMPMFHDLEAREVSWRDLILLAGGMFLIYKSTKEMHEKLEHADESHGEAPKAGTAAFGKVLIQIAIIDIVFSLDSVITAVGMVNHVPVMIAAMVLAMMVMLMFSKAISDFVAKHPTLKLLALSFLILIGVVLVAEGLGQHIDKGYIYFAMAFAVGVEFLNLQLRKSNAPVHLHTPDLPQEA